MGRIDHTMQTSGDGHVRDMQRKTPPQYEKQTKTEITFISPHQSKDALRQTHITITHQLIIGRI
jgi:hypothetical protein